MRIVIFGFGFTSDAFWRFVHQHFDAALTTVRTPEKAARITSGTLDVAIFNEHESDPKIATALLEADCVLISIGPDNAGDPVLRRYADAIASSPSIKWIGYLSTIGVYGDHQGAWVDESAPLNPSHQRTENRVRVEKEWLALGERSGKSVQIFRLAGIYGPGRNAIRNLDERAQRIVKPGQVFNRTHVEDIAQVLLASIAKPRNGAIYNVCDDEPAPPQDVLLYAAELTGRVAPPEVPFENAVMSEMARSFYADNKRVKNDLIKTELGVRLRYPTYREGLRALYEAGEGRAAK
jgi:nucleoside-diphosphate-sugar epimerase